MIDFSTYIDCACNSAGGEESKGGSHDRLGELHCGYVVVFEDFVVCVCEVDCDG